jgi:hypothetical protein
MVHSLTHFPLVNPRVRSLRTQWALQDSNLRPTGYEPAALPLS